MNLINIKVSLKWVLAKPYNHPPEIHVIIYIYPVSSFIFHQDGISPWPCRYGVE